MPRKVIELSESETLKREQILQRIGHTIKRLRTESGMTQRELAEAAGVSHPHLLLVEVGGPALSVVLLYNISLVFGVPISIFFEEQDENTTMAPILVKLSSELRRIDNAFEQKRDSFSKLINQLEKVVEALENKTKNDSIK